MIKWPIKSSIRNEAYKNAIRAVKTNWMMIDGGFSSKKTKKKTVTVNRRKKTLIRFEFIALVVNCDCLCWTELKRRWEKTHKALKFDSSEWFSFFVDNRASCVCRWRHLSDAKCKFLFFIFSISTHWWITSDWNRFRCSCKSRIQSWFWFFPHLRRVH